MKSSVPLASWGMAALCYGALAVTGAYAEKTVSRDAVRHLRADGPSVAATRVASPLPEPIETLQLRRLNGSGVVAGGPPPPGTPVYLNESGAPQAYVPGTGHRLADDATLAGGACDAAYFSVGAYNFAAAQGTYTATVELWNGDPCDPGSAPIADTLVTFTDIPVFHPDNSRASLLEATVDPTLPIPATVWIAVTFSGQRAADAAWLVAGQAETGLTANYFSENDPTPNPDDCGLFIFQGGSPWAGFWAQINCDIPVPPPGACCNDTTCTQTTQAACTAPGVWQGAFSTCVPNSCITGGCCTGTDFETCNDTHEGGCPDGLFHPGVSCAANACGPNFLVYLNSFPTGVFVGLDANEKWADRFTLGPGAPCNSAAFEVHFAGDPGTADPPPTFDARVELWTNNDRGTTDETDDIPLAPIPGKARDFPGLTADLTRQILRGGPFAGPELPEIVWMVLTTSSDIGGPIFAGMAELGFSADGFAQFNDPTAPNAWSVGYRFPPNGFDPTNCPGPTCVPAGSFRAAVWCEGNPPIGACCNDVSGTCTDGVEPAACEGRWMRDVTCDTAPFNPPCGAHACCYPNSLTCPGPFCTIVCDDKTPAQCAGLEGSSAPGLFCVDVTCPALACINRPGDCFAPHTTTTGCDNAFCCDKVCDQDPRCCNVAWDAVCATMARNLCSSDQCADALPIVNAGTFPFDNTTASTDGPAHDACANVGDDEQISKDVWFCWTSPCTNTVFVRTCGQADFDTKLAVYEGCTCPPGDDNLLDCGDDRCGASALQSTAVFHAAAHNQYLIRVGSYPSVPAPSGDGAIVITCGPPAQSICPTAPGNSCCDTAGLTSPACDNNDCCERVCGCDFYCCEVEWDASCATNGLGGSGCGAQVLCPVLCGACPSGAVTFDDPPSGVVDAGRPGTPQSAVPPQGIDSLLVSAPAGADNPKCWSLCETANTGSANGVISVTDSGGGQFTVHLARPITPGAVTKVKYLGNNTTATLTYHPSNVNGVGGANATDVANLSAALNGTFVLPWGLYSGDIDGSGMITGADILEAAALQLGEGAHQTWGGTAQPSPAACP